MCFNTANDRPHIKQSMESLESHLRGRPNFFQCIIECCRRDIRCVLRFYKSASPLFKSIDDLLPRLLLYSRLPVVAVNDIIWFEFFQIGTIVENLLGNNTRNPLYAFYDRTTLLIIHIWQAFVARD